MEYFFSHIGYILAAGVILGLLAFSAVFFADKSARVSAEAEDEREIIATGETSCGYNCSSCMRADSCTKEGKRI